MPIRTVLTILQEFERYVDFINENGNDDVVDAVKVNDDVLLVTMMGHCGEMYELKVSLSDEARELQINNVASGTSVFDFADEYGWTQEDVRYMKFGK